MILITEFQNGVKFGKESLMDTPRCAAYNCGDKIKGRGYKISLYSKSDRYFHIYCGTNANIWLNLVSFFKDEEKADLWFYSPNPLLGNLQPVDILEQGRPDKLLKFIKELLAENER